MAHKYKTVCISKNLEFERGLGYVYNNGKHYWPESSREDFLELINDWNRQSLLQANITGKVEYLYIAL